MNKAPTVLLALTQIIQQGYLLSFVFMLEQRAPETSELVTNVLLFNNVFLALLVQPIIFVCLKEKRLKKIGLVGEGFALIIIVLLYNGMNASQNVPIDLGTIVYQASLMYLFFVDIYIRHGLLINGDKVWLQRISILFLLGSLASLIVILLSRQTEYSFLAYYCLPLPFLISSVAFSLIQRVYAPRKFNKAATRLHRQDFTQIMSLGIMFAIVPLSWLLVSAMSDLRSSVKSTEVYLVSQVIGVLSFFPQFIMKYMVLTSSGKQSVRLLCWVGMRIVVLMSPLLFFSCIFLSSVFGLSIVNITFVVLTATILIFSTPFAAQIVSTGEYNKGIKINLIWMTILVIANAIFVVDLTTFLLALLAAYSIHVAVFIIFLLD